MFPGYSDILDKVGNLPECRPFWVLSRCPALTKNMKMGWK